MSFLQMSLHGAVMIAVITILRALVLNKVPKKTFLVLWAMALVRLLVPFSLPSRLSVYTLFARQIPAGSDATAASPLPALPAAPVTVTPQVTAPSAQAVSLWAVIWLAGIAVCALTFAVLYIRCYREFQTSLPVEHDYARRWLAAHPLRRKLAIRQSDRVSSPLTFGVLRPVILMPKSTDWSDEGALCFVLEHEFVHVQRFDALSKLALIAAVCVHWFDPLVWVMYVLADRDLELSCDETVVRRFGGARADYARTLIRMMETRGGGTPLCSGFSKNAMEERITAIMKTKKTTIISFVLAAVLIAGTAAAFATSAQAEADNDDRATAAYGTNIQPDAELLAIGLTYQNSTWFYQGKAVAGMYDDNGGTYTNDAATGDVYLAIKRGSDGKVTELAPITKKQFVELVDRHLNDVETEVGESSLMSYVDPTDGKTYYSFDDGKTFEPMTDEEFEARFPTPNVEWWTYDEYKAWLDNEKVQLQSLLGETDSIGGQKFTWTQEEIDKTIAMYEETLADIKNGVMYSRSVDGDDQLVMSYDPADISTSTDEKELYVKLGNGEEYTFGPYETDEELLAAVKPFCEKQVQLGNMEQSEADEIIARHSR